jgi:hypothetical protein
VVRHKEKLQVHRDAGYERKRADVSELEARSA